MSTVPDKSKNKERGLPQLARMTGLALSLGFELAAGPFVGYFIGSALVQNFGWDGMTVPILVFVGFFAGLYAAMRTVSMISQIDRKSSGS